MDNENQSGDVFGEHYFKHMYGEHGLKKFNLHWWSVRWYAAMVERCLRDVGGRRILEIGCGTGL